MSKKLQTMAVDSKSRVQFFLKWSLPLVMAGLYFFMNASYAHANWSEEKAADNPEKQGWESSFPESERDR